VVGLTRVRITQLIDLTFLAPDLQEKILLLEAIDGRGSPSIRASAPASGSRNSHCAPTGEGTSLRQSARSMSRQSAFDLPELVVDLSQGSRQKHDGISYLSMTLDHSNEGILVGTATSP
jgi:hypothetical protein